jgi:Endonuclease I/Secretion system C-terminal sorting domain
MRSKNYLLAAQMGLSLSLFLGTAQQSQAQVFWYHEPVYPTLTGTQLYDSVRLNYRATRVLTYSDARDTLYARIYKVGDSVECVYTGHKLYLPNNVNPRSYLGQSGGADGINAEHTYPQSMGAATGFPESDMNHLFPSRAAANTARSNNPFGEIADNQTDSWYIRNQVQANVPSSNIGGYSELLNNVKFEPRESHKGNVARAMMYFYTMYRAEATAANPNYFEPQREDLCRWHMQDPVDELEWNRAHLIARHQGGRRNPFILDCTLAKRMYCNTVILDNCSWLGVENMEAVGLSNLVAFPNPAENYTRILFDLDRPQEVKLSVLNSLGQEIAVLAQGNIQAGEHNYTWQTEAQPAGFYLYRLQIGAFVSTQKIIVVK